MSLLRVLIDEQWPKIESIFADHKAFLEIALRSLSRPCLFMSHENIPEVGVDCRELTDCIQSEVGRFVGAHNFKLEHLVEVANGPRKELHIDPLYLFWIEHPPTVCIH